LIPPPPIISHQSSQFLYNAFPVESCLDERIHENMNAEIAAGTIHNIDDCLGYLSWTYYARRVKKNPMYYGAESSRPEHVDAHLLAFANDSVESLRAQGCIEINKVEQLSEIVPTSLGIAASQYYLSHLTPKQMQIAIREGRKIILKSLKSIPVGTLMLAGALKGFIAQPLCRPILVDEQSIAWLLFALCSTHEFDEIPVRHNEELLNEELSRKVMWGPDVADVLAESKGARQYRNIEIYQDPHTKTFLMVQAYLEHTKLPISDYVNDTKSVIENLPRMLAAMSFIAASDMERVEGSFELMTQFSRTRQILVARCKVDDDPLLQLSGCSTDDAKRIRNKHQDASAKTQAMSLLEFRALSRDETGKQFQNVWQGRLKEDALHRLYSFPLIRLMETSCSFENEVGKLSLTIDMDRIAPFSKRMDREDDSFILTLLLGSLNQRFLLANIQLRLSRFGSWTVKKELTFDWEKAKSDGGTVILRLMIDEIRGLDTETMVELSSTSSYF
jgi:Sec63 Brl domain